MCNGGVKFLLASVRTFGILNFVGFENRRFFATNQNVKKKLFAILKGGVSKKRTLHISLIAIYF